VIQDGAAQRAEPPQMLLDGDLVRTRNGRAEIIFGDGTLLHLSHDTELEILGPERLRLTSGRAMVRMSHAAARPYVIDTPASSVRLEAQGEYGVTTDRRALLEIAVARGTATINDTSQWTIRGGQMLTIAGAGARPVIQMYNSARWDAFTQWAYDRSNGFAASQSAAQLPYELRPYAPVLDQHGRWDYVEPHGHVWFPSVASNWRPYYDGSWSLTRYGWTWHGHDRWAWPTHHYGRWGFSGSSWYWIPATSWAPAWVSWSVASGYVSWAPLHPAYAPNYYPGRGWTALPRHHFTPRRNVRAYGIDAERLDEVTRRSIITQALPERRGDDVAVPRGSTMAPGARGNVRRAPATPAPAGVMPSRPEQAAPATETPATRSRRPQDHPGYAPPPSWNGGAERRGGAVREPAAANGGDRDSGSRERAGRPAPRSTTPQGDAPAARPQSPTGSQGGAVERGGGSRRGGAGGASAPGAQPAPSGQGGARRRPGAAH
jgi:hypothetical protein